MKMEADERKKQIRQAAMKVFLDKGFRNTVMNDIMEATGLSRGGLYHHYGSTYEILYDIMVEGNKYREKIIYDEMNKTSQDFSEVLSEIILEKMLYQSDYVSIYVMFLQELNHDDKLKDLYKKLKKSSSDSILMLFDEDDEELYDDQTLVDNTEYHSERALVKAVAKKYGISEDIITVL